MSMTQRKMFSIDADARNVDLVYNLFYKGYSKYFMNDIVASVIIPAYNEERYLGKCLDSLKTQTFSDFETIVINDGSNDKTSKVAAKYDVKLWTISHGGPGNAKNFGAKKASGKILIFLDADMYIHKDYLRELIKPILFGKYIGTYSTAEYVGNINNLWSKCWNITHNIDSNKRINANKENAIFRAILREKFFSFRGFNPSYGYYDDHTLIRKRLKILSVQNAICYHNNPSTLREVFFSARWIGRSIEFRLNFRNILRYSPINSIRISIEKITHGAPIQFIIFKLIFDFGIITGMIFKNAKHNYAK